MAAIAFLEVGRPFGENDLVRLEQRVGFELPEELVAFLRNSNGGRPEYCTFTIPELEVAVDLCEVIGIGERWGIEYWLDEYGTDMPSRSIPVGFETYGNCVLVRDDGGVYYWDIYGIYGKGKGSRIYYVADSFRSFIDELERK